MTGFSTIACMGAFLFSVLRTSAGCFGDSNLCFGCPPRGTLAGFRWISVPVDWETCTAFDESVSASVPIRSLRRMRVPYKFAVFRNVRPKAISIRCQYFVHHLTYSENFHQKYTIVYICLNRWIKTLLLALTAITTTAVAPRYGSGISLLLWSFSVSSAIGLTGFLFFCSFPLRCVNTSWALSTLLSKIIASLRFDLTSNSCFGLLFDFWQMGVCLA